MSSPYTDLLERITSRRARVGVVGLGYVGLPLAVEFARAGFDDHRHRPRRAEGRRDQPRRVVHPRRADRRRRGARRRPSACRRRPTSRSSRRSTPSTSACRRRCARPRTRTCPTSSRRSKQIAAHLHPGMLVILESTTYPGTTDEVVQPMLESGGPEGRATTSSSPSRPSASTRATRRSTRTTCRRSSAASTPDCSQLAAALYATAIETVVPVSSTAASPRW